MSSIFFENNEYQRDEQVGAELTYHPAGDPADAYVFPLTISGRKRTLLVMESIKATNLRRNLYSVLKNVCATREPVEVTLGSHAAFAIVPRATSDTRAKRPLVDLDAVAAFCKKYQVKSLALFGSVLRADFTSASDVDVLVDLGERHVDVHEMFKMVDHLEAVFGRKVDMVERSNLRRVDPLRRREILTTARVIYDEEAYDA